MIRGDAPDSGIVNRIVSMSLINDLAGVFHLAVEERIPNRMFGYQIHASLEKAFEGIREVEVSLRILACWIPFMETDQKIEIAASRVKRAFGSGSKNIETLHLVIVAQL